MPLSAKEGWLETLLELLPFPVLSLCLLEMERCMRSIMVLVCSTHEAFIGGLGGRIYRRIKKFLTN